MAWRERQDGRLRRARKNILGRPETVCVLQRAGLLPDRPFMHERASLDRLSAVKSSTRIVINIIGGRVAANRRPAIAGTLI
jgi:hypothetical protein